MGILTRYLIRSHAAPFFFALSVLTALLYLNSVAQKLDDLVGKSLPWDLVAEFLLLTLPHTLALSIPMAVLVAVLYAFADLGSNSELMAMSASGVRPIRLTAPVLCFGAVLTVVMLGFNDRILPEANHRLKNLSVSINKKRPTFLLEEGIVNRLQDGEGKQFFLHASRIDPVTSELTDVEIRTLAPDGYRTIYADRGSMAWNSSRTDLFMTLHDGEIHEVDPRDDVNYEWTAFSVEVLPLRGINNELEQQSGAQRTDREMSFAMLRAQADTFRGRMDSIQAVSIEAARSAILADLGRTDTGVERADEDEGMDAFADLEDNIAVHATLERGFRNSMNAHLVEYHKKIAIAIACLAFALIGAPLSMRFPRGGVGMVIVVSVTVFAIYWVGLIGGEELADRGIVRPWIAMWAANAIFFIVGLILFSGVGREGSTARGGGWGESMRALLGRVPRRRAAVASGRVAGAPAAGTARVAGGRGAEG